MSYINTDLFVHAPLRTPISGCNTVLAHLVTSRLRAQQTASSAGNPVLRMHWECTSDKNNRSSLQAPWQAE